MQTNLRKLAPCLLALTLLACQKEVNPNVDPAMPDTAGRNIKHTTDLSFYALTTNNTIEKLNTLDPETPIQSVTLTGLQPGESLLAIDIRPATGQLYGLGSSNRIYTVDPSTGMVTAVGTGSFAPALGSGIVGFDFNPTVDRIRIVTSTGQNLRAHPTTGAVVFVDGAINGAPGAMIGGSAYTNSRAGATTTALYNLDVAGNTLYLQNPPNNGTQVEVGMLGLDIEGDGGFDIDPATNMGLGLFEVNGKSTLFLVDLASGRTTTIRFKKNTMYRGLAITAM